MTLLNNGRDTDETLGMIPLHDVPLNNLLTVLKPHSCVSFLLESPNPESIHLGSIIDRLQGINIKKEHEIEEATIVPDEFLHEGAITSSTEITSVGQVGSLIIGKAWIDVPKRYSYRDRNVIILRSYLVVFIIHQIGKKYYLEVFSSRPRSLDFVSCILSLLEKEGFKVFRLELKSDTIRQIIKEMNGIYIDSHVDNIDPYLESIHAHGRGHERSPAYMALVRRGNLVICIFQTGILHERDLERPPNSVMIISQDLLTRFYTCETYKQHLDILSRFIIPRATVGRILGETEPSFSLFGYDIDDEDDED